MILSAIAAKLKGRAQRDFKGQLYEAAIIVQAVSWYLRYPLSYRDIVIRRAIGSDSLLVQAG